MSEKQPKYLSSHHIYQQGMKYMRPILLTTLLTFSSAALAACSNVPSEEPHESSVSQQKTALASDAVFVINGADATLSVLDAKGTKVFTTLKLPSGSFPHHAYLSPDGQTLAISLPGMDFSGGHGGGGHGGSHNMAGRFALLKTDTGEVKTIKSTPAMHHNAVFSPNGKEIWAAAMETQGRVLVYDADSLNILKEIAVGAQPAEVTFSADGKRAFVANGESGSVTVIDAQDKTVVDTLQVDKNPVGAWPGSDNRMYVDNEESETISVIDAASLKLVQTIQLGFMPGMAALHPNQQELWVSDVKNGQVVIFKRSDATQALARAQEIATGAGAHAIAFSKNGSLAFVSNQEASTISILDTATGNKLRDLQVGTKPNGLAVR